MRIILPHLVMGFPWNLQEFIGICANFTLVILYKSHKISHNDEPLFFFHFELLIDSFFLYCYFRFRNSLFFRHTCLEHRFCWDATRKLKVFLIWNVRIQKFFFFLDQLLVWIFDT
ncbi:unnamed protein product [Rhizophagus irregularis]|nr:unnamed protein product [Rhizophagus irregularis]